MEKFLLTKVENFILLIEVKRLRAYGGLLTKIENLIILTDRTVYFKRPRRAC